MQNNENKNPLGHPSKKPDSENLSSVLARAAVLSIVLSFIFILTLSHANQTLLNLLSSSEPKSVQPVPGQWHKYAMVAHAMGGIEGCSYTNSVDAFMENYEKGFRLFEVDLISTSDGYLVTCHDWKSMIETLSTGPTQNNDSQITSIHELNVTFAEFNKMKVFGKFKPMSLRDLILLMRMYPDAYIITDTKTADTAVSDFHAIVEACSGDSLVLDRFIPQIYDFDMYDKVKSVYNFPEVIFTFYQYWDSIEEAARLCKEKGIERITIEHSRLNDEALAILKNYNLIIYSHTVNNAALANQLFAKGVYGLYTDYLPYDFALGN